MGSFAELTLAFTFSAETPPGVIAAFGEWATGEEAPELPTLEQAFGGTSFEVDAHLGSYFGDDPMESLSLAEQASVWRYLAASGDNVYFPGTPATVLRWDRYAAHWTLTTRTLPKETGPWVRAMISPLGEWAIEGSKEEPRFVGYIVDEYSARPVLIWSVGGGPFQFEGEFGEP